MQRNFSYRPLVARFLPIIFLIFAMPTLRGAIIGPDSYGYILDDARAHEWIEISTTGQLVVGAGNDISSNHPTSGISGPVKLGHPFTLYGVTYHQLVPTSNGYLSGNPAETGADATNDCPFPATPSHGSGARILAFHDDLEIPPTGGAGVYYQYFDISPHSHARCGVSVFTWKNVTFAGGTTMFNFQALLFDTGDIIINYDNAGMILGSSATTGIMHSDVHTALKWFCNEFTINSDRAILYEPPTMFVGTTADENRPNPPANAMSLREVIRDIPTGGKIYFPSSTSVLNFTSNLVVNRSMSFVGDPPNSPNLFFTTPNLSGPSFTVENGAVLNFDNIPMSDSAGDMITARGNAHVKLANCGIAGAGGSAIKISGGAHVALARTTIDAPGPVNADGVSISDGTLRMYESLIDGSRGYGIGVKHPEGYVPARPSVELFHSSIIRNWSGGIIGNGEFVITASTVSDNAGPGFSMNAGGDLTVTQSSIMDNRRGVVLDGGSSAHFTRTVLSRNPGIGTTAASDLVVNSGSAVSGGWNIVGNSHGVFTVGNDIVTADPKFTPVGPYACIDRQGIGARRGYNHLYCHMPLAGSPAIDGGGLAALPGFTTDIRGLPRVVNGDNTGGAILDIGPVEIPAFVTVTTAIDENNGAGAGAGTSLREILELGDLRATVRFAPGLNGQSILTSPLDGGTGSPLVVGGFRFVDASMLPDGITIDGGTQNAGYDWTLAGGTYFHGVNFSRGSYKAFNAEWPLILSNCHFFANSSSQPKIPERLNAGGAIQSNDLLHLTHCTFTGNSSTAASSSAGGGAVHIQTFIPAGSVETRGYGYFIGCRFVNNNSVTFGGAIWVHPASRRAWIDRCQFTNNGGGYGGALYLTGGTSYRTRAAVLRSSFSENYAGQDFAAGGLIIGPPAGLTYPVRHCTFDRNTTGWKGGAISNAGGLGIVDISNCTITRNVAGVGGGSIHSSYGTIRLSNSIIDDSVIGTDSSALPESERVIHVENGGVFQSFGNNLAGEVVPLLNHATDVTNTDPLLTDLLDHGGPTLSRHPLAGSPAIDTGPLTSSSLMDQRGLPGRSGARADRGAVESFPMIVTTSADELNNPAGANRSLRETFRDAFPGQHVLFNDDTMASRTINLQTGLNDQLVISKTLLIDATDTSGGVTISGPLSARCVNIENGDRTVQFHGVSFTNGRASLNGGAIRKGAGTTLVISRSAIHENSAAGGGGILVLGGLAQFTNVTFSANSATAGGGGAILAQTGAVVEMGHCTFIGNNSTTGGATIDLDGDASLSAFLTAFGEKGPTSGSVPSFHLDAGATMQSLGRNLYFDGPHPWSAGNDLSGPSGIGSELEDAGGLARIHYLTMGSVLLDAAPASNAGGVIIDARGFPRVYGPGIDIGAAEMNAVDYGIDADTDEDGMPDDWELDNGFNITDPTDADDDEDGDGQSNLAEYVAQTDPNLSTSVFRILSITRNSATQVTIVWSSVPGLQYSVWRSPSLGAGDWLHHSTVSATAATHSAVISGATPVPAGKHFYRVQTTNP